MKRESLEKGWVNTLKEFLWSVNPHHLYDSSCQISDGLGPLQQMYACTPLCGLILYDDEGRTQNFPNHPKIVVSSAAWTLCSRKLSYLVYFGHGSKPIFRVSPFCRAQSASSQFQFTEFISRRGLTSGDTHGSATVRLLHSSFLLLLSATLRCVIFGVELLIWCCSKAVITDDYAVCAFWVNDVSSIQTQMVATSK